MGLWNQQQKKQLEEREAETAKSSAESLTPETPKSRKGEPIGHEEPSPAKTEEPLLVIADSEEDSSSTSSSESSGQETGESESSDESSKAEPLKLKAPKGSRARIPSSDSSGKVVKQ